jgi:hypothetical protein
MDEINSKQRTLDKFNAYFMIAGMLEVFLFVLITHQFLLMLIGVITIIPAYLALSKREIKWNYFTGIWAILKYNPIGIAMVSFIIGDFLGGTSETLFGEILMFSSSIILFLVVIGSFVLGIVILVKTESFKKLQRKKR